MPWINIIHNEYVTMDFSTDTKIIYHTFHKPIFGQVFRDFLNEGVDVLREYGAEKWLSDDRLNSVIPEDDLVWSIEDWSPRAIAAGWKYWAIVVPEDFAGREMMAELRDTYHKKGVQLQVFISPQPAFEWLESL